MYECVKERLPQCVEPTFRRVHRWVSEAPWECVTPEDVFLELQRQAQCESRDANTVTSPNSGPEDNIDTGVVYSHSNTSENVAVTLGTTSESNSAYGKSYYLELL